MDEDKKMSLLTQHLATIISYRNHEHQTWMSLFFASVTTNSLLIVALFNSQETSFWDALVIAGIALLFLYVLDHAQLRAFQAMRTWEELGKRIEAELFVKNDLHSFSYNYFRRYLGPDAKYSVKKIKDMSDASEVLNYTDAMKGSARNLINKYHIRASIATWGMLLLYFYFQD